VSFLETNGESHRTQFTVGRFFGADRSGHLPVDLLLQWHTKDRLLELMVWICGMDIAVTVSETARGLLGPDLRVLMLPEYPGV
jgi:hypothetical protein